MPKPNQKCATKFCRGIATQTGHSPYCSRCRGRRFAKAHPITNHWMKLKYRAAERGIEFKLTLEEYTEFWNSSGYGLLHGKTSHSLSIDRIDSSKGYVKGNIRAVTLSYNSRRQFVPYFQNSAPDAEELRRVERLVQEAYSQTQECNHTHQNGSSISPDRIQAQTPL